MSAFTQPIRCYRSILSRPPTIEIAFRYRTYEFTPKAVLNEINSRLETFQFAINERRVIATVAHIQHNSNALKANVICSARKIRVLSS